VPVELGEIRQPSGKRITACAIEADFDATRCVSNTFALEWPKESGQLQEFPEVDRAEWFDVPTAREKLVKGQVGFLDELLARIA
jgi:predicted NUDIX family NTP pyrophosphohydrolase